MTEDERNELNYVTAVQGEAPVRMAGHEARHLSMETVAVLDMVDSPVAAPLRAALNGAGGGEAPGVMRAYDLAVLAWVFCAPEDDVLGVALMCSPGYNVPAVKAALQYTRGWSVAEVSAVVQHLAAEMKALRAAVFESAAPEVPGDVGGKKKATGNVGCR